MIKARRRRGQIDRDLSFGDRLLTVDEAAERLAVSRATIFTYFKKGLKKTLISTRVLRVNPYHLSEFVSHRVVTSERKS